MLERDFALMGNGRFNCIGIGLALRGVLSGLLSRDEEEGKREISVRYHGMNKAHEQEMHRPDKHSKSHDFM